MSEPVSSTAPNADDRGTSDGKSHTKFRLQLGVVNDSGHEQVEEVVQMIAMKWQSRPSASPWRKAS